MIISRKFLCRTVAAMVFACVLSVSGCTGDLEDRVGVLEGKVASLEELTASLKAKMEAGKMITTVTELSNQAGWKISFSDGTSIDVLHGAPGAPGTTPRIEMKTVGNEIHIFVDGVDTGINIKGADGATPAITLQAVGEEVHVFINGVDTGINVKGANGSNAVAPVVTLQEVGEEVHVFIDGVDTGINVKGASPEITLEEVGEEVHVFIDGVDTGVNVKGGDAFVAFNIGENPGDATENNRWIWYTTDPEADTTIAPTEADGWVPLLNISNVGPVASIVDNLDGTITITMNDADGTEFIFGKYMEVPAGIVVVKVETIDMGQFEVTLRVNPSTAVIPDDATWTLEAMGTRAYALNETTAFTYTAPALKTPDVLGEYTMTLEGTAEYDMTKNYMLALVMQIGDVQFSSGMFTVFSQGDIAAGDILADINAPLAAVVEEIFPGATVAELAEKTVLDISAASDASAVTSLEGLEYFPALEDLKWADGALEGVLNLDQNPALKTVDVSGNNLEGIYVYNNPGLTEVNVSGNASLTWVALPSDVVYENLTSLNVSGCDVGGGAEVRLLNLTQLTALENLDVSGNTNLPALDLSANTNLVNANFSGNNFSGGAPDLQNLASLQILNMSNTRITGVQLFAGDPAADPSTWVWLPIVDLDLSGNTIAGLDLSGLTPTLTMLNLSGNQISGGDYSSLVNLEKLDVSNNPLPALNVDALVKLTDLNISNCDMPIIAISKNILLTKFNCEGNNGGGVPDEDPGIFTVHGWFADGAEPSTDFTTGSWQYDPDGENKTVTVKYYNIVP